MSRNTGEFYSTLEVCHRQDPKHESTVGLDLSEKIACSPFAASVEGLCELGDHRASVLSSKPDSDEESQSSRLDRRRCGMSPRRFWGMVLGIGFLLAAAIAGGIVGGLFGNRSQTETSSLEIMGSSDMPSPDVPIDPTVTSQLSAVSWIGTGASGCICCRALFYQQNGTLLMSRTVGNGWVQQHLRSITDNSLALDVKSGTPLASIYTYQASGGSDEDITLFYLDSNNHIRDLVASSDDLGSWKQGQFWSSNVTTDDNSNLAAIGHYCPYCLNSSLVVYQRDGGDLYSIHGRDMSIQTHLDKTDDGTPLAMFPGMNVAAGTAQIRLFFNRDGDIDEFIFNGDNALGWGSGEANLVPSYERASVLTAAPAITLGLVMALSDGGNIAVSYLSSAGSWNNSDLTATFLDETGNITTSKPPTDVAAIALSQDFHLYTMTKDGSRILEYGWSAAKPDSFELTRTVL